MRYKRPSVDDNKQKWEFCLQNFFRLSFFLPKPGDDFVHKLQESKNLHINEWNRLIKTFQCILSTVLPNQLTIPIPQ